MNQSDYSAFVLSHIKANHPEFLPTVVFNEDSSFVCHIKSPKGMLSLWVKTWGAIITLELVSKNTDAAWHTHMSLVGCKEELTPAEEVEELTTYLQAIFTGKAPIVFDSDGEIYISDVFEQDLETLRSGQVLHFETWRNL